MGVPEGGLNRDTVILLDHICTLDKRRLIEHWGKLNPVTTTKPDEALKISLGLVPL